MQARNCCWQARINTPRCISSDWLVICHLLSCSGCVWVRVRFSTSEACKAHKDIKGSSFVAPTTIAPRPPSTPHHTTPHHTTPHHTTPHHTTPHTHTHTHANSPNSLAHILTLTFPSQPVFHQKWVFPCTGPFHTRPPPQQH
jgi:hypothetical protein